MPLFRRPFDRRQAVARAAVPPDARALAQLAASAMRRYLTSSADEVAAAALHEPTAVVEYEGKLAALAQIGWRMPPNAWLRAVAVDGRLDAGYALPLLVPHLHQMLPVRAINNVYITLDEWSAPWLRAPLERLHYRHVMDVWSYEKIGMSVPAWGNPDVVVRRARLDDLKAVLHLDAICFPTPWGKGEEILAPALAHGPYFTVAELDGQIIGYAYVTVHHAGFHAHLVRIAVVPQMQGQAIGVRLLAEVVRYCRHQRIETLSLNTQDYNVGAQRLYEWFGFHRTGEVQTVLGWESDVGL